MTLIHPLQSLWDFALAFYAQPQVAETCLCLQDQYRVNVCLLIGLRWLDEREQYLLEAQVAELQLHVQVWTQEFIEPLRKLRRLLKQTIEPYAQDELQEQVRNTIKQAELLAEKKLLAEIEYWLTQLPVTKKISDDTNIEHYLKKLTVPKSIIELIQKEFGGH